MPVAFSALMLFVAEHRKQTRFVLAIVDNILRCLEGTAYSSRSLAILSRTPCSFCSLVSLAVLYFLDSAFHSSLLF